MARAKGCRIDVLHLTSLKIHQEPGPSMPASKRRRVCLAWIAPHVPASMPPICKACACVTKEINIECARSLAAPGSSQHLTCLMNFWRLLDAAVFSPSSMLWISEALRSFRLNLGAQRALRLIYSNASTRILASEAALVANEYLASEQPSLRFRVVKRRKRRKGKKEKGKKKE